MTENLRDTPEANVDENKHRGFLALKRLVQTLTPDEATCVWAYLDSCDVMELIEVVAPMSPDFKRNSETENL